MASPLRATAASGRRSASIAAALVLMTGFATGSARQAAMPALAPGTAITQTTRVTRIHTYGVMLRPDDVLDVRVSQDQVSVALTLFDPHGRIVQKLDVPESDPLPLRLIARAAVSGTHRLEARVNDRGGEVGQDRAFTLDVRALGPPTGTDLERVRISEALARAGDLALRERLADLERSIPVYLEAADGWRTLGEQELEASTLLSLASVTGLFAQFRATSAPAFQRLIPLLRELGYPTVEADARHRLAFEYDDDGRLALARDALIENTVLTATLADRWRYARDLQLASHLEMQLGNYEEARSLAGQTITVATAIGRQDYEAMALSTLATLQAHAGDLRAALEQQERAVSLGSGTRRHRDLLNKLGLLYLAAEDVDRAEARLTDALRIEGRFVQRDSEALTRIALGDVALARGDRAEARRRYQEAMVILQRSGYLPYRCRLEHRLGALDLADGDLEGAAARVAEALSISHDLGDAACEAAARGGLADVAQAAGRLEEAHAHALRLVQLSDEFREAIISLDARSIGFARLAPAFERAVDLTMRLAGTDGGSPRIGEALLLHERALARGLLDGLASERVERRAQVPEALERERRQAAEARRAKVVEHETAVQRRASGRATALAGEIATLATRLRAVEARIDAVNPRHAAFTRPAPMALADLQKLLDPDTLLVEYALGDARSYVWVVGATGVQARTLAPRAVIEAAVRRAHAALARVPAGGSVAARDADLAVSLRDVARLVLEPIATELTTPRLVVVATGSLALIPFAALPFPNGTDAAPLLARREIVTLPSATVLAALRTVEARRAGPARSVAVFADPVYERDDPRVANVATNMPAVPARVGVSSEATSISRAWTRGAGAPLSLTRLPFSHREADAIQRYAASPPLRLVGLDATRERALAPDLARYRIVHFAAHGLQRPDLPNLSGLALSLVDGGGRMRNGFLMLPDIYDLQLNADLVVLSACDTALGTEVRGEGILGLPRGFMYAGAARVVSSLWRVDDEATAALMDGFYRRILRSGATPAAALRAAQLELRQTPRWRTPFFWAGFVLQGDWR